MTLSSDKKESAVTFIDVRKFYTETEGACTNHNHGVIEDVSIDALHALMDHVDGINVCPICLMASVVVAAGHLYGRMLAEYELISTIPYDCVKDVTQLTLACVLGGVHAHGGFVSGTPDNISEMLRSSVDEWCPPQSQ